MSTTPDPMVNGPQDADTTAEGDMRHSYARTSAITGLHTLLRNVNSPSVGVDGDQEMFELATFMVDLAVTLHRGEVALLRVGDETDARRVAQAVIVGGSPPPDYQLSTNDVAEGHRVIRRLAGQPDA